MAITFPLTTSHVTYGTPTSLANLASGTLIAWINPTAFVNGNRVTFKGTGATIRQSCFIGGTTGNFQYSIAGATSYARETNDNPLKLNQWACVVSTWIFGTGGALWSGTTQLPITARSLGPSQPNGTTRTDDAANPLSFGHRNDDAQNLSGAGGGLFLWNRDLALADLEEMRQLTGWLCGLMPPPPRGIAIPSGNVLCAPYGAHTLAQPDYSPYNNTGLGVSVTAVTPIPVRVPPPWLPGLTRVA